MLSRKLFRLSTVLRSHTLLSQRFYAQRLSQIENIKRDENKLLTEDYASKLLEDLKTPFPSKILHILNVDKNNLQGVHLISIMKTMLTVYKRRYNEDKKIQNLTEQPFFKTICSAVIVNMHKLSVSEAMEILKTLHRMKATDKKLFIIESILKKISASVNDLSFVDICELSTIIAKVPETEIKKKLNNLMIYKFSKKLDTDFNENNIEHLGRALSFVNSNLYDETLIETLISKLENYSGEIPLKNSIRILEEICAMTRYSKKLINLVKKINYHIGKNVDMLDPNQTLFITYVLGSHFQKSTRQDGFYDPILNDKLVRNIISCNAGLEDSLSLLKNLRYMRHLNYELLNYSCASYFERKALRNEDIERELNKLLILLNGLASAKYKSNFWEDIQKQFIENNKILKYDYETLCIIAINLVTLGCYPYKILEKLFNDKFLPKKQYYLIWTFRNLYQSLKVNPNYDGPMPTKLQLELLETESLQIYDILKNNEKCNNVDDIHKYLIEGLGGDAYVKKRLMTKLLHQIDFVVAFDKNGHPVQINDQSERDTDCIEILEDMKIPPEYKKIIILQLPSQWFFRNHDSKLIGQFQLIEDTLEAMGYSVIKLSILEWENTPHEKKLSTIMNKIKSKLNNNETNLVSSEMAESKSKCEKLGM